MSTLKTIATIAAGSKVSFEDPLTPGTFLELPEVRTIGAIGEQGEFVETTPIGSTTRTYVPGMRTPPDKELTGNDIENANHAKFLQMATDNDTVKMKIELSNNRIADFTLALSGWQINEPEGNDVLQWTVFGKQSGSVTWTIATGP